MANILLMPPKSSKTTVVNGRSYSCATGSTITVPDFDAQVLIANGWVPVATTGTTAQRPANPYVGQLYHDTTLGYVICYEGAAWRNPASGSSV
ncbi:MAG TPA: hypothetical protein VEF90_16545 [Xanthobacteraceae bacterium]|nr:hypothetical protein [Xanthobacteraceae bacterium]